MSSTIAHWSGEAFSQLIDVGIVPDSTAWRNWLDDEEKYAQWRAECKQAIAECMAAAIRDTIRESGLCTCVLEKLESCLRAPDKEEAP